MKYFTHEIITENVIRIIDVFENCAYLVIGDEKSCLLDTLDGFGDLKTYVEKLTDKPIFVILSHGHIDHGSGAGQFDEVYLNEDDFELFKYHCSSDTRLRMYKEDIKDKEILASDMIPIYDGVLYPIEHNQEFDLGGITIRMLKVPGHTFGMMVPLILEEKIAIFGDAAGVGTLFLGKESTKISEYRKNLNVLKDNEDLYDTILRNHGTFESPKELIDNVISAADKILSGDHEFTIVSSHGYEFYVAEPIGEDGNRLDGIQGNIKFTKDNL